MSVVVAGLFNDSKLAGEAVAELKQKGYTNRVSVIMKDENGEVKNTNVKGEAIGGTLAGATSGGALGALTGLLAGAVSTTIPGAVLLVAGPLALTWGLTGAAIGALGGGLLGALTDIGFSQEKAQLISDSIMRGDVVVTVEGDGTRLQGIEKDLIDNGAVETVSIAQIP